MRLHRPLLIGPAIATVLLVGACGGDDEDSASGALATSTSAPAISGAGAEPSGATGPTGATGTTGATGPSAATGAAAEEEIDVCALVSQAEVEGILGQSVGAPNYTSMGTAGAASGLGGGDCTFQATGITPVVSINVLAWSDEDDAESSFDLFGIDEEVEGIGDKAVNTQPVGDISVLQGRYELSVDLYFVNDDEDADFEMARQIAELAVSRLP